MECNCTDYHQITCHIKSLCRPIDVDTIHLQRCRTLANNLPKFSDTYDMVGTLDFAVLVWEGPPYSTQKLVLKKPNSHTLIRCSSLPTHFDGNSSPKPSWKPGWISVSVKSVASCCANAPKCYPHGKNTKILKWRKKNFKLFLQEPLRLRLNHLRCIWGLWLNLDSQDGRIKKWLERYTPGLWRGSFKSMQNRKLWRIG